MMEHGPSGGVPQLGGLVEGHSHTDPLDGLSKLRIAQIPPCLECRPSQHYLGWAIMAELVVDRLPAHSCVLVCISGTWYLAHTVRRHLWPWRNHLNVRIAADECSGSVSLVILRHLFGHLTLQSSRPKARASHSRVWGETAAHHSWAGLAKGRPRAQNRFHCYVSSFRVQRNFQTA